MAEQMLYAIIETNEAALQDQAIFFTGIDDAPLEIVSYRDLAAVVSAIDVSRLTGDQPEHLQAALVKYQQVTLALLQYWTLVPVRFGLTARDEEHVKAVLEQTYLQLRTFLSRLAGKVELVVQASWDLSKIVQGIAAQDERIVQAKKDNAHNPPSVEIGRMLFEATEARKRELNATIHTHLLPWATDSEEGVQKAAVSEIQEPGSTRVELIFNRSYLVEKAREPLFDAAVDQLGTRYQETLKFRYIGPLPAYSFVNIELHRGNFELINQARQLLALPEHASPEDIKRAYRRLVLLCHPDRYPEDPQAVERFRALTHAYEILETYCRSLQTFLGVPPPYSFSRKQVEDSFLVKDRRDRLSL